MILEDMRALPRTPLVLAEGTPLRPNLVAPVLATSAHAVWLVPTPGCHRARLEQRGARENSIQRSLELGSEIERQASDCGQALFRVDESRGIDEVVATVEHSFGEALTHGPRARTLAERRMLLREANKAIVSQVRGYYARPWADGEADPVVRAFICECGDPGCDADAVLAVGAVSDEPVLAPGHPPGESGPHAPLPGAY